MLIVLEIPENKVPEHLRSFIKTSGRKKLAGQKRGLSKTKKIHFMLLTSVLLWSSSWIEWLKDNTSDRPFSRSY